MMRSRKLGHVVALDFSFHTFHGVQWIVLHFICEASRFHHAVVAGRADDGNCTSEHLVDLLINWTTFLGVPAKWHVDGEGCFTGEPFLR